MFRAWDQTTGISGTTMNAGVGGGSTAFSVNIGQAFVTIVPVVASNHAPTLSSSNPHLGSIARRAKVPRKLVGITVSSILAITGANDFDPNSRSGIAITGMNSRDGKLYYTVNGGKKWNVLSSADAGSSLLLASDPSVRVYYRPNRKLTNLEIGAFTFRAWDQTSGLNGMRVNTSSIGGSTAFSAADAQAVVTVL